MGNIQKVQIVEKKGSGLAAAGMVLGIIGICLSFIPIINNASFVLGALAVVFGIIGLAKKAGAKAIVALVLGVLTVIIVIALQMQWAKDLNKLSEDINKSIDKTQQDIDKAAKDAQDSMNQITTVDDVVNRFKAAGMTVENESEPYYQMISANAGKEVDVDGVNVEIYTFDDANKQSAASETLNADDLSEVKHDLISVYIHSTDQTVIDKISNALK